MDNVRKELRNQNALFIAITFMVTFSCWLPLALCKEIKPNTGLFLTLHLIGGSGPTLAPFIIITLFDRKALNAYLTRLIKWKVNVAWYLLILAAVTTVCATLVLIDRQHKYSIQSVQMMVIVFPLMIIGGGIEEFGWRGILLENIIRSRTPLFASTFVIGVIWSLWHLPLFYINGMGQHGRSFLLFTISIIGISFILTTIYINTRSTFIAILFHTLINFSYNIGFMPSADNLLGAKVQSLSFLLIGLTLFIAFTASAGYTGKKTKRP